MVSKAQQQKICTLAQTVLDIRAKYTGVTLADLYDPTLMKTDLRKAHQALDSAVDKLYRPAAFAGDRDRVEYLFSLYEKDVASLISASKQMKKQGKQKKPKAKD